MITHIGNTPIPKKYQDRISWIDHEDNGEGYEWVIYLNKPWYANEYAIIREATIQRCLFELRHTYQLGVTHNERTEVSCDR